MTEGYASLSEKEKQALRLIVRGNDAKSTARQLGLSVHTINERLREARRKLSVSSSREAARIVLGAEEPLSQFVMDKPLGDAGAPPGMGSLDYRAWHRRAWIIGGGLTVSLILVVLALNAASPVATTRPATAQAAEVDTAVAAATARSAQAWLALVDRARWADSWSASGQQFRQSTTSSSWAALIQSVRSPLGAVRSRSVISHAKVAQPPHSYIVLKFRTSFANKPAAVETISLEQEGREWKVVGYWIA